ncbi:hypothetical protein [Mesorhizobium silamurunense]|uniref:hypothetical protein n=1 Tax=Mesorhizobium silamurunense TaxID=499528 RepID=UPI00177F1492|nr:hypothetical protein [Mesorhizobium silamurunense]
MELFSEFVTLVGIPLDPPIGNTDTIMERLDDATSDAPVPTRIVAFANVSAAPVKLKGNGALAGYYDLYVTLSPTRESVGEAIYHFEDDTNGTFESKAEFWPLFELRPLGQGHSIFVDTGVARVPGFPMNIGSAGGRWSMRPPTDRVVTSFRAAPFFYEGEVIITAQRDGQISPLVAMQHAGPTIAACAKDQAEFTSADYAGRMGRVRFGTTKPAANRELE